MVAVLSIAVCMAFLFNNLIVQAQNAPPPQVNCNSQVSALLPCLGYVQGQVKYPPQSCCTGLASVVKASPFCLCSLIATGPGSITGINSTLALELPAKCNMKGLDPRLCSGILGVPAPAALPPRAPIASGPVGNQSGAPAPVQSPTTPAPASSTPPRAESPVSGPSSQSSVPVAAPVSSPQAPFPSPFTGFPVSQAPVPSQAPAPSPRHHHRGGHGHKRPFDCENGDMNVFLSDLFALDPALENPCPVTKDPKAPAPVPATEIAPEPPVVAADPIPTPSSSPPPQNEAQALPPVSVVQENAPTLAPTAGGASNAAAATVYCVKALALPVAIAFCSLLA